MNENDRPSAVLLTIITDGKENESKEYNTNSVRRLVTDHITKYSWNIEYVGAEPNEAATMIVANSYGIYNYANYNTNDTLGTFTGVTTRSANARVSA